MASGLPGGAADESHLSTKPLRGSSPWRYLTTMPKMPAGVFHGSNDQVRTPQLQRCLILALQGCGKKLCTFLQLFLEASKIPSLDHIVPGGLGTSHTILRSKWVQGS